MVMIKSARRDLFWRDCRETDGAGPANRSFQGGKKSLHATLS